MAGVQSICEQAHLMIVLSHFTDFRVGFSLIRVGYTSQFLKSHLTQTLEINGLKEVIGLTFN